MKIFIKITCNLLLTLALANCGKNQFDQLNSQNPTDGADEIHYTNPDKNDQIVYSKSINNIYKVISPKCVKGLASNADDPIVQERISELSRLMENSQVHNAEGDNYGGATLVINYEDGNSLTFNMDVQNPESGEISSGSREIKEFFNELSEEIERNGIIACRGTGKK